MRLYLSSFRIGNYADRLVALCRGGRRAGVIANAMDFATSSYRLGAVQREVDSLTELGFHCTEVDLRDRPSAADLAGFDLLWTRGGNVFELRRRIFDAGLDEALTELITTDRLVWAGYSAGACVLGTDLTELARVDDISVVSEPMFDGLGILDRPLVPHIDSPDHPETDVCNEVSAVLTSQNVPHWVLRDGQVLMIDGNQPELLA